jgi:hypothetical protein
MPSASASEREVGEALDRVLDLLINGIHAPVGTFGFVIGEGTPPASAVMQDNK